MRLKASSLYIDGEGVVCGEDGVAVFDRLHSKANDHACFLYAFDLLELDGEDLRPSPLEKRKALLRRLLRSRKSASCSTNILKATALCSITLAAWALRASCRSGAIWPTVHAEWKSWLKIKNPNSPAMARIEEGTPW